MICEIYSGKQLSARSYAEDSYTDAVEWSDDGEIDAAVQSQWFVLAWDTVSTSYLSDATVHGPYTLNCDAVEQASLLSEAK